MPPAAAQHPPAYLLGEVQMLRWTLVAAGLAMAPMAAAQLSATEQRDLYAAAGRCAALYTVLADASDEDSKQQKEFIDRGALFVVLMTGMNDGDQKSAESDYDAAHNALVAEVGAMSEASIERNLLAQAEECAEIEAASEAL
jgi:hypothetical protein